MANFRFNAKNFFLTYAQCPAPKEELLEHLKTLSTLKWCVISEETHEDGEQHLHAVGEWNARVDWTSESCYDYLGFHPNIQVPRNILATITYVKKEGNYISYGPVPTPIPTALPTPSLLTLAKTLTPDDFFEYCVREKVQYSYYKEAINRATNSVRTLNEDHVAEGLMTIPALHFLAPTEGKVTVVVGPTGCGKTTWAKKNSLKPALIIRHIDDLKELRPSHKSIIFDDMVFTHWQPENQIHLLDYFDISSIHIRYGTISIPAKIQKIMTCNKIPISIEHEAIARRVNIINLL